MRQIFIDELFNYAKTNKKIVLIAGDLGYSIVDKFQKNYPARFINAGIAEQNMAGFAAGLALSGKAPWIYSIANFTTLRCLEQIRNDICYHNANVKIVSVGSGFAYGLQGYTHHAVEDVSIMRALPRMNIFSPSNNDETRYAVKKMLDIDAPCYLRLGKVDQKVNCQDLVNGSDRFPLIVPLITGYEHTIFSTGPVTQLIDQWIRDNNYSVNLYSVPVIKPIDLNMLAEAVNLSKAIITIEEHVISGGFGSALIEDIHSLYLNGRVKNIPKVFRYGIDDEIKSNMTSEIFIQNIISQLQELMTKLRIVS
jgi:transketolase